MNSITKSNTAVTGSIGDIMARQGKTLPQVMVDVDMVVVLDLSGSMSWEMRVDSTMPVPAGLNMGAFITKAQLAEEQLRQLQEEYQGRVMLFTFSDTCVPVPSGSVAHASRMPGMGKSTSFTTIVDNALIKRLNGAGKITVIISDGEADERTGYLLSAFSGWKNLQTIYIGDDGAVGAGADLLRQLAHATNGTATVNKPGVWVEVVEPLLLGEGK